MLKLVRLELKRNTMKLYALSLLVIFAVLLALTYLFAYVPHKQAGNPLEAMLMDAISFMFSTYNNISSLTCLVGLSMFTILSAVMYARFIIEDYKGKRTYLLFSYPINRSKVVFAKIIIVFMFTVISMMVCNAAVFSVFFFTESILPLVTGEVLSAQTIAETIKSTVIFALLAGTLGIVSMKIGFIKKSIPATIITGVILSSLITNVLGVSILTGEALGNSIIAIVLTIVALCTGVFFIIDLMQSVSKMEAE